MMADERLLGVSGEWSRRMSPRKTRKAFVEGENYLEFPEFLA
jgi:hypothetical protein